MNEYQMEVLLFKLVILIHKNDGKTDSWTDKNCI